MASVRIDLPDQQAAVLTAKATVQGLGLEEWFKKLVQQEAENDRSAPPDKRYRLTGLMKLCDTEASLTVQWLGGPPVGREAL